MGWGQRFAEWFGRSRQRHEEDLGRELRSHLELEAQEKEESGVAPKDAPYAARRELGNLALIKEDTRKTWSTISFEGFAKDLRYGIRQLLRNPGFTAVAIGTIALGIGANTAVFSVINAVLLREPPYREPSRLVGLWQSLPKVGDIRMGTSPPEYLDYRDRNRVFASIAGYAREDFDLTDQGGAERIEAVRVSSSLFETLGLSPLLGRTFTDEEEQPGNNNVTALSHAYWQQRYGGNPQVLGDTLRLNEKLHTIVGIMPPGFVFPSTAASVEDPPALWVPLAFTPQQVADRAADFGTNVIARLAPGVSIEQARSDVARVAEEFQRENPDIYSGNIGLRTTVEPFAADDAARVRPALFTLAAAVGFVLLIACSNVANLLLGRASVRQREMALRSALGGSRVRLIRQLLTECLLLTGFGGALGCVLAQLITTAAARLGPEQLGIRHAEVDLTVLGFTLALCGLTGLLCGLAPAFAWSRPNVGETLKEAGRQSSGLGRGGRRVRSALVVLEAASAVVLLVCAGLLIRSFVEVLRVPPGFDPEGVLIARTSFNRARYQDSNQRRLAEQAIADRLAALPGVTQVAVTTHVPLADSRFIGFALESGDPHEIHWAANALVSDEYFVAMGIPLVAGRTFDASDIPGAPVAAIVNETMARSFWPGADPIGERIIWGGRRLTIVGVAGDVRLQALETDVAPTIYNSIYQVESGATTRAVFTVRTDALDPSGLAPAIRETIPSVDRGLPVFDIRTMNDIVAGSLATRRFSMLLLGSFAALALALALIGLYAVLSYTVEQRTPELGVRLALGARPSQLVRQLLGQGLRLSATGILLGAVLAGGAATAISSLLFGVGALDPVAFLAAAALLLLTALAASYAPARRASRVDPMVALRYE